eukprot:7705013-Pyramimonas_sp.AAC.1
MDSFNGITHTFGHFWLAVLQASILRVVWRAGRRKSTAFMIYNNRPKATAERAVKLFEVADSNEQLLEDLQWYTDLQVNRPRPHVDYPDVQVNRPRPHVDSPDVQ